MKKMRCSGLVLLVFLIFIGVFVSAQLDDIADDLEERREQIDDGLDVVTDKEKREEKLEESWTEFLEKNAFGRFLLRVSEVLSYLSPFFVFLVGVEYSLSWLFFFSLLFWVAILIIVYKPLKEVAQLDGGLAFLIAIVVATLAGKSGGIKLGLNLFLLPLFENPWIMLLAALIAILVLILYAVYLKKTGKSIREMIKKSRDEKREYRQRIKDRVEEKVMKAKGFDV
jgi:hypothetical protein